jgi:hypothetical protein
MCEYEKLSTLITVMADTQFCYIRDASGMCLARRGLCMLAQQYMEHPRLSDLVDLEYELWVWVGQQPGVAASGPLAWREFHLDGLALARRLAALMRSQGVQVIYRCEYFGEGQEGISIGPF